MSSNILLWRADEQNLDPIVIEHILRSEPAFDGIRFDEPGGAAIESVFSDASSGYSVFVRLSSELDVISLTSTSDTALRAALILQRSLKTPLRIIDTDYSFDLILSDFADLDELNAAIEKSRG
jgi:hypothetical protein